jgi:hypothetical protein
MPVAAGTQWCLMDGAQFTKHSLKRGHILQVECRRTWKAIMWTNAHKVVFCMDAVTEIIDKNDSLNIRLKFIEGIDIGNDSIIIISVTFKNI